MELSYLIAKIFALFFVAVGLSVVLGNLDVNKMVKSFQDSPALMIMSGFMMVVTGGLMIQYHNLWVKDWRVLITIMGWATLIKGVVFIAFPSLMPIVGSKFKNVNVQPLGFVIMAIGLGFGYLGFFA